MKNRITAALCVALLSLSLAGCLGNSNKSAGDVFWDVVDFTGDVIDTLETGTAYALGRIPTYCAWAAQKDREFQDSRLSIKYPADLVTAEAKAMAALSVPCNNYPTTIQQALAQFKPAYQAFKNAKASAENFANQLNAK